MYIEEAKENSLLLDSRQDVSDFLNNVYQLSDANISDNASETTREIKKMMEHLPEATKKTVSMMIDAICSARRGFYCVEDKEVTHDGIKEQTCKENVEWAYFIDFIKNFPEKCLWFIDFGKGGQAVIPQIQQTVIAAFQQMTTSFVTHNANVTTLGNMLRIDSFSPPSSDLREAIEGADIRFRCSEQDKFGSWLSFSQRNMKLPAILQELRKFVERDCVMNVARGPFDSSKMPGIDFVSEIGSYLNQTLLGIARVEAIDGKKNQLYVSAIEAIYRNVTQTINDTFTATTQAMGMNLTSTNSTDVRHMDTGVIANDSFVNSTVMSFFEMMINGTIINNGSSLDLSNSTETNPNNETSLGWGDVWMLPVAAAGFLVFGCLCGYLNGIIEYQSLRGSNNDDVENNQQNNDELERVSQTLLNNNTTNEVNNVDTTVPVVNSDTFQLNGFSREEDHSNLMTENKNENEGRKTTLEQPGQGQEKSLLLHNTKDATANLLKAKIKGNTLKKVDYKILRNISMDSKEKRLMNKITNIGSFFSFNNKGNRQGVQTNNNISRLGQHQSV